MTTLRIFESVSLLETDCSLRHPKQTRRVYSREIPHRTSEAARLSCAGLMLLATTAGKPSLQVPYGAKGDYNNHRALHRLLPFKLPPFGLTMQVLYGSPIIYITRKAGCKSNQVIYTLDSEQLLNQNYTAIPTNFTKQLVPLCSKAANSQQYFKIFWICSSNIYQQWHKQVFDQVISRGEVHTSVCRWQQWHSG